MDREAVDAEQREQIRDLERERRAWCREKLGRLADWLPLPPEPPKPTEEPPRE